MVLDEKSRALFFIKEAMSECIATPGGVWEEMHRLMEDVMA